MNLLPIPCPAELIPNVTAGSGEALAAAGEAGVTYVAIEYRNECWTVRIARHPIHVIDHAVAATVRRAVKALVEGGEVDARAAVGPDGLVLQGVADEGRARQLAAAFHAALYGDPCPLARAVPVRPDS